LFGLLGLVLLLGVAPAYAQTAQAGKSQYESRCSRCHGADGNGGELGPAIVRRLARLDDNATGLVFVCDDSGSFAAVDASNGKRLWEFQTSQEWKSSPMVYSFDGEERIVASAGQTIIALGPAHQ
jgi:cytochrome c2